MVTVTGMEVTTVEELAESVSTWVPVPGPAANEAVTPLGSPLAVSATAPEKPPWFVTVMVLVVLSPGATVRAAGDTDSTKPGGGVVPLSIANWRLDGAYLIQVSPACEFAEAG